MTKELNRRSFMGATAGAGAVMTGLSGSLLARRRSLNDTLQVAVLGPGGRGMYLLRKCLEHADAYNARITAVCEIWKRNQEISTNHLREHYGTPPKLYHHIDDLLADDGIDAVIIATADHQHGKMLKMVVEAGKDAYCEKPMANVLSEANDALDACKKAGTVVQIGTQGRSHPKCIAARRIMKDQLIGDVVRVTLVENEYSPYRWRRSPAQLAECREEDLNWKEFLLGKPYRPFDPRIYRSFRLFKDFSSGIYDQWMSHDIDTLHYLTGEPYPLTARAEGGIYRYKDYRENPDTTEAIFEYGTGDKRFLASYGCCLINGAGTGYTFQGTKGTLSFEKSPLFNEVPWRVSGDGIRGDEALKPGAKQMQGEYIAGEPGAMPNHRFPHMANWLDCVRRRDVEGISCPAEAGYGHSIACIMATDSLWSGRKMIFDPEKRTITPA